MRNSKKRSSGSTPEETLQSVAKGEEKSEKKNKEKKENKKNNDHHNISKCKDVKDSSPTAQKKSKNNTEIKVETEQNAKPKTKVKTEQKAHTRPTKKITKKSCKDIKRGASPEEMLQLIAEGEEREAKKAKGDIDKNKIVKPALNFTTENKILQILETPPVEMKKSFTQRLLFIFHPNPTKTKVAVLLILLTLFAAALAFGLSTVNFSPGIVFGALKIPERPQIVTLDFTADETDQHHKTTEASLTQAKEATLTVMNAYHQMNRALLTYGSNFNINLIQSSDNNQWEINYGSSTSFDFSDISIPADAIIKSVVIFIEHFEEEGFIPEKLEWTIGAGWPESPYIWASIKAPVQIAEIDGVIDSWDITSLVDTCEKINSLQLQINNNNVTDSKTSIDYTYVTVKWE